MTELQWKEWPEGCPECDWSLEVLSADPRSGWGTDGDPVRCINPECRLHHEHGHLSCSAEDDIYAWFPDD